MKKLMLLFVACLSIAAFAENTSSSTNGLTLVDLTSPTGTAAYSPTNLKNTSGAGGAFDNTFTDAGRWLVQKTACYVTYTFDTPTVVNAYGVYNSYINYSEVARAPKSFQLLGSDDGTSWTTLDARTNETGWVLKEYRFYQTANTTAYTYYKFNILSNNGDGYTQLQELEFYHLDTDIRSLVVTGTPGEYGAVTPAYGTGMTNKDASVTCSACDVWTNADTTVAATCTGYKTYTNGADGVSWVEWQSGSEHAFTFTQPDGGAKVEWQFAVTALVTASAGTGGTTSGTGWYPVGGAATLTATPGASAAFAYWTGDVPSAQAKDNPLVLTVLSNMNVTAVFSNVRYVSTTGSDANDGLTEVTSFATVNTAVTNLAGAVGRVYVAAGTYNISAPIIISNAISVIGMTGNPEDVIIHNTKTISGDTDAHIFTLNHAGAGLYSLTAENSKVRNKTQAGIVINAGGVVSNCVVRNGSCNPSYWGGPGGILIMSGANPALVSHCVITNNSSGYSTDGSVVPGGVSVESAYGRVEDSLIAYNTFNNGTSAKACAGGIRLTAGTLVSCTVVSNTCVGTNTSNVGGLLISSQTATLTNCVIAGNYNVTTASGAPLYGNSTNAVNCATDTAEPINSTCVTGAVEALFADFAGGDFSPRFSGALVNAGAAYAPCAGTDLAGNPRVVETIDVGCYEFPAPLGFPHIAIGALPDVNVSYDWISSHLGIDATQAGNHDLTVAALNALGANGVPRWQSYVLGLDSTNAAVVVLSDAKQDASASTVTLFARNVEPPIGTGATVEYVLEESADGLNWTETSRKSVNMLPAGLSTDRVFYRVRADIILR